MSLQEIIEGVNLEDIKEVKVVSKAEARKADTEAEENFCIPTILLMENAGKSVAEETIKVLKKKNLKDVIVIAGSGNNGGDGLCASKHIFNAGYRVKIASLFDEKKLGRDPEINYKIVKKLGIPIFKIETPQDLRTLIPQKCVIIDSIFGTGISRNIENKYFLDVIELVNATRQENKDTYIVAVDIPSGLDSDTGIPRPVAIRADKTVTFAPAKIGLFIGESIHYTGEIIICDIGIPRHIWEKSKFILLSKRVASYIVKERLSTQHKGSFGHLLCVAGGLGRAGAAILVGKGALRTGAGLVTLMVPECVYTPVAQGAAEYMVIPAPAKGRSFSEEAKELFDEFVENKSAVVVGPGIWQESDVKNLLIHIIEKLKKLQIPAVFDADALNILADIGLESIRGLKAIITPHPGEAARLLKKSVGEIQKDRILNVKELADKISPSGIAVLKGFRTIISDGENFFINMSGGVELATGGTGDVLSGVIGGFLAQGYSLSEAAVLGVFVHGIAGEMVAGQKGNFKLSLAAEVANAIDLALGELTKLKT